MVADGDRWVDSYLSFFRLLVWLGYVMLVEVANFIATSGRRHIYPVSKLLHL